MKEPPARSLVLGSQALSLLLRNDRQMVARTEAARRAGVRVLLSALTVVEAVHGKTDVTRLNWVLSRLQVEPVSQADSMTAVRLLLDAGGLHGHRYAIDALVAAMALHPAPSSFSPATATTGRSSAGAASASWTCEAGQDSCVHEFTGTNDTRSSRPTAGRVPAPSEH